MRVLSSSARKSQRDERGLVALYELPRAECLRGRFESADGVPPSGLGALTVVPSTAECTEGVGLRALGDRQAASAVSDGSVSQLMPQLRSARALTVELWVRPSASSGGTSEQLEPIFALGEPSAAQSGLSTGGCQSDRYALLVGGFVGQQGSPRSPIHFQGEPR